MSFLNNLNWRYATKKFDENKKVSSEDLNKILEAIRLAPTSCGTQSFRALVISDKAIREKLLPASWNQAQITTSSELIVFVARRDLATLTDEFFTELSGGDATIRESLAGYENMVKGGTGHLEGDRAVRYSSEQAHIALGFALAAAAELNIDTCALGGFLPDEYRKILNLSENEVPCVLLAIGYRADSEQPRDKFRLKSETIFKHI